MRHGLLIVVILLTVLFASGCGQNSPTAPPTPSTAGPTTFTVSGTLRRAFSGVIEGVRLEVEDGEHAGKTATSGADGTYAITEIAGGFTLRASRDDYISQTIAVSLSSDMTVDFVLGNVWPAEITAVMLGTLPVVQGLLFQDGDENNPSGPSEYNNGVVILRTSGNPVSGKLGTIAHEVCHAHQDVDGNILNWPDSAEGQAFLGATGWRLEGGVWVGGEENSPVGNAGPIEDGAETCAMYYDPGDSWSDDFMAGFMPNRLAWAQTWLPR